MATLAPSLRRLFREVDARWPRRPHNVDGWYRRYVRGARPSDHHPDGKGMVHAVDITSAGISPMTVVALCARNSMPTEYVIYNRRIYSRHRGWMGVRYTGPHPHHDHIHVSIRYSRSAENYSGTWGVANVSGGSDWVKRVTVPSDSWEYHQVIGATSDRFSTLAAELNRSAGQINRIR
jgi:hypothetical protein